MTKAIDESNDEVRLTYALTDVVVNARIVKDLASRSTKNGYFQDLDPTLKPDGYDRVCDVYNPSRKINGEWKFNLLNLDQTRQAFGCDMHRHGIHVEVDTVRELIGRYEAYALVVKKRLAKNLQEASVKSGTDELLIEDTNDESGDAIDDEKILDARKTVSSGNRFRNLLYTDWKLDQPPFGMEERDFRTDSGLPGTGNAVLLAHLASGKLTPLQSAIINDKRILARVENKILSTVLKPLLPGNDGILWPDQRIRTSIRAFLTAPGRYSSVRPCMTNFGNKKGQEQLPTVFGCPPGRMLIGFDVDQFHIRIMANHWGIKRYIKGFEEGIDPHIGMACIMVGEDRVRNASGWGADGYNPKGKPKSGEAKALRDTAKPVGYAYAYLCLMRENQLEHAAALLLTQLKALEVSATDSAGRAILDECGVQKLALPYLNLKEEVVAEWVRRIYRSEQDWNRAWQKAIDTYARNKRMNNGVGFMESYYFKRRSGNLSDGKNQELVNFPVLSTEQDIMAIMEFKVMNLLLTSWARYNPVYLLNVYDAVKLEIDDPAGPGAPRCPPGHDKKDTVKCPHCIKRMELVKELEFTGAVKVGNEIPYTVEGHWGWTLADI